MEIEKNVKEFIYLKKCIQAIEIKLEWGSSINWTVYNFKLLSKLISSSSNISVSITTLQRIFGKCKTYKDYYNPQSATKNALAKFIGYKSWIEFKSKNAEFSDPFLNAEILTEEGVVNPVVQPYNKTKLLNTGVVLLTSVNDIKVETNKVSLNSFKKPSTMIVVLFGIILILTTVSSYLLYQYYNLPKNKVLFIANQKAGFGPRTVEFKYDISKLSPDNVFIDFEESVHQLPRNKKTITHFFDFPGHYDVKILQNGNILASQAIDILSNGWTPMLSYSNFIRALPAKALVKGQGRMQVDAKELKKLGADTLSEYWTEMRNFGNYNADGDNYTLEATVKNNRNNGSINCYDTELEVVGSMGRSRVVFVGEGCSNYAKVKFADKIFEGDYDRLSGFAQNLNSWKNIKIQVIDKKVKV